MKCLNCGGIGKIRPCDLVDFSDCNACDGTGNAPRFIYETIDRQQIVEYLSRNPNPRYRMVSACLDQDRDWFHIIFEEKE